MSFSTDVKTVQEVNTSKTRMKGTVLKLKTTMHKNKEMGLQDLQRILKF